MSKGSGSGLPLLVSAGWA
ncbi:MAG TPA: hypothetical protein DD437_08255 [Rhodobiaceae bacterium]|nr:hypothetical protein [Rhodobiaceae bacterium]